VNKKLALLEKVYII